MDAVLGQAPVTPKALDVVAPHDPAPGLVRVDAAGVTVVANLGARTDPVTYPRAQDDEVWRFPCR